LHPISVLKTRQQALGTQNVPFQSILKNEGRREAFHLLTRGMGTTLGLSIPARAIYISALEGTRTSLSGPTEMILQKYMGPEEAHVIIAATTLSSSLAGGVAAVAAQSLVVPMDVIAQRQMILDKSEYLKGNGTTRAIFATVIGEPGGWRNLYTGFGLSLFSSLPAGTAWWGTYGASHHLLHEWAMTTSRDRASNFPLSLESELWIKRGVAQVISGMMAAACAGILTMPIDVVKTRLQVSSKGESIQDVSRYLYKKHGAKAFFRGTGPRILHMGLWGTILSSAYELLRHVSHKDYHLSQ
jgi:solute carrier family 25 protein 44